jgi:hypothetical protein
MSASSPAAAAGVRPGDILARNDAQIFIPVRIGKAAA